MPPRKSKKYDAAQNKRVKFTNWQSTRWVLNNLDDETLAEIDRTPIDVERQFDWFTHLVDNGLSIKIDWDNFSEAYQVTLQGAWEGYPNCGHAVSGRSDEGVADAVKIVWGKFEFVAQGDLVACYEKPVKRGKRG